MTARAQVATDAPWRVRLAPGPRTLLEDLFHYRRRYRRVIPTTAQLAERHGVDRSTIKRWLAELRAGGVLVCVYNGGQGQRCIYYVGPRAAEQARDENPAWSENARFGGLRMGERVRAKRLAKDRKNEILTAPGSSSTERGTPSESPPSENQAPAAPAADRDAPPCRPPAGDPKPAAASVADAGELAAAHALRLATPAPERPKPDEPLTPPRAAGSSPRGAGAAARDRGRPTRRSVAKDRWDLWCRAWGLWRAYAAKAQGGPPADHPADVGAMKALLSAALLRYRGAEELALDDLAYGFRAYIRDKRQRFKPLTRLVRMREDYGRAPAEFRAPWRKADAVVRRPAFELGAVVDVRAIATGGAPIETTRQSPRTGEGSAGAAPPARADAPTLLELARKNVERAEEAHGRGFGSLRAVERAKRLLGELEAKDRAT